MHEVRNYYDYQLQNRWQLLLMGGINIACFGIGYNDRASKNMVGSRIRPFLFKVMWRCGPVERPVEPTWATGWPGCTFEPMGILGLRMRWQ